MVQQYSTAIPLSTIYFVGIETTLTSAQHRVEQRDPAGIHLFAHM
jgi:hypothetical protein